MALEARNVTRQFLRKRSDTNVFNAVENVSLTLRGGRVTVVTGPSGSGKSTLLSMLAGILRPTSGTVQADGTDLYAMGDEELSRYRNAHIGVVPQGQTAIQSLTAWDNVLLPYELSQGRGKDPDAAAKVRAHAQELLERTGIADLASVMPREMSGGELRRMAIVRAMVMRPDAILADEPTADLDEENTAIVLSLLRLAADEGSAVLVVTHDKDVLSWADEVLHLRNGRLGDAQETTEAA